jgi:superfamily II DNA or RNA helicase
MIQLRDYQLAALAAVEENEGSTVEDASESSGRRVQRQLVVLPTGGGKTIVFSERIRRTGGTALILAHRDELLQQAANKLRFVAPELALNIGFVQAGRNDVHAPIVVASVQTLANAKRLAQLPRIFKNVIVDEAHHGTADSYQRIFKHVSQSKNFIGFTATPERADDSDLRNAFDTLAYARSLEEMIREGYLCDLRALRVQLDQLDLKSVKKSRGDYQADALGHAMENAGAVEHVVAAYLQHAEGKRTIAFFPTVALSIAAAEGFRAAGVRAAHLDGTTDRDTRRMMLEDLTAGLLDVVCNVAVLTEGFDEPSLECIILASPTKSRIKYAQQVGRGTRLSPGKKDCLILDVSGVSDDLSLQSVGMLFDLKDPPRPGETAMQARDRELAEEDARVEAEAAREADKENADLEERREAARRRKLAAERRDLFDRDAIQWGRIDGRWILGLKGETLVLEHHDDGPAGWRVLLLNDTRARVVARNLDLGYAQGAAEHLVRRHAAVALADKHAPWRDAKASPGQRGYLYKLGVKTPKGMSKGQAADLITQAIAEQRLARFDRATTEAAA